MSRTNFSGATSDKHLMELWLSGKPETTQDQYRRTAKEFFLLVKSPIRELTADDVISWRDSLTGADATRAREVSTIKSLLSFAWKTGYSDVNVGRIIKCVKVVSRLHERLLDEETIRTLVQTAREGRDRTLVRLLYVAGLRISEAVHLRFIDVSPGRITVIGKGKKSRTIAVPPTLSEALQTLRSLSDEVTSYVFKSSRGKPIGVRTARMIITAIAKKAGFKLRPHTLRHCHATHSLDNGAPIHLLMNTLGHSNIATTSVYLHVRPDKSSAQFIRSV